MFNVTKYPHGTFGWADGMSTDVSKAAPFYTGLMSWEKNEMPISDDDFYTMYLKDGKQVAGMGQMPPDMKAQGIPSIWTSYVIVDDVDAIAARVTELGGTIMMPPMDVVDSGRMMMAVDPSGATVGFWQPKNHKGADLVNIPGAMTWNELSTRDSQAARDFFGALLGWEYDKIDGMDYYTIMNKGRANGGIMQMTEEWGDMPPNWAVYFSVADIDATVAKAQELGGNIMMPVHDAGDIGCFSVIADPTGGVACYIQLNEPQPWEE